MKKYLLVSVAILLATAFCLTAEEASIAEPKIDIEADATVTWGVDLGSGNGKTAEERGVQHGFKNEASWKVKFPLIKKGDKTSAKNEVPVYAEVTLKDIELNIQSKHDKKDFAFDGKVDKLEAKLVFYGAYLQVHNKPDFKTNYANLWDPIAADDFKADKHSYQFKPGFEGFGTKIGYANKNFMDLDVGLKFGSNGNWESKGEDAKLKQDIHVFDGTEKLQEGWTAKKIVSSDEDAKDIYNEGETPRPGVYRVSKTTPAKSANHSKYGIGFDFAMKPLDKMLGIKFNVNATLATAFDVTKDGEVKRGYTSGLYSNHDKKSGALNVGTEVTSEPMDGLKLKFGFDGGSKLTTGNTDGSGNDIYGFLWDMLFDTTYKWISGGVYVASAGTGYAGWNWQAPDASMLRTADMAVYLKFETKGKKKDDGSLEDSYIMEGLDAGAYVTMQRLLTKKPKDSKETIDMLLKLWASYKLNLNDAMWIKPFATFWGETNHIKVGSGIEPVTKPYFGIAYDLGVTYGPAEKVEVTAKWVHGKVGNNTYLGLIEKPVNKQVHNGTFTLAVKVKY